MCGFGWIAVLLSWIAFIAAGFWVELRDLTAPLSTDRVCCGRERFFQCLPSRGPPLGVLVLGKWEMEEKGLVANVITYRAGGALEWDSRSI